MSTAKASPSPEKLAELKRRSERHQATLREFDRRRQGKK